MQVQTHSATSTPPRIALLASASLASLPQMLAWPGWLGVGACWLVVSAIAATAQAQATTQSPAQSGMTAASQASATTTAAPAVKIWEFSPYDVEVRYAFDSSVTTSAVAQQRFVHELQNQLDRTFQAAWRATLTEISPKLVGQLTRNFDQLTLDNLTTNELVLVIAAKHPDTKTLRTFEAAVEGLPQIATLAEAQQTVAAAVADLQLAETSLSGKMLSKLTVEAGGLTALQEQVAAGTIPGALLPRYAVDSQNTDLRPLITLLPWQTETLLRQRDKLFFLIVGMDGDQFTVRVREIDCPMQFVGPMFKGSTLHWPSASRVAGSALVHAFAPIARVEDAEAKTAMLRHRAGGMIVDDANPARIRIGDVLQPIVRRDDRNGIPTLLEPLSFTYGAVTASDGVKMACNVYTYSGGPGLQGRQNRRTQRILLRVRPQGLQSDLRIAVRGEQGRAQAGCFVYDRHPLTDDFTLLGRTDWRGQFTVQAPSEPVSILPEAVRAERFKTKLEVERKRREAEEVANAATEAAKNNEAGDHEAGHSTTTQPAPTAEPATSAVAETDNMNAPDDAVITLNHPLIHIYIKSGDTVLAKLPLVPGLRQLEVAELPDDSLRLQSEAFVRGFQGQILDLIGLRNLLAARVQLYIKEEKLEQAESVLDELRRLPSYNEMRDELSTIQRRMLEASGENVPRAARSRIDRMFQNTRDMLQKYLQDELVANTERAFDNARKGT